MSSARTSRSRVSPPVWGKGPSARSGSRSGWEACRPMWIGRLSSSPNTRNALTGPSTIGHRPSAPATNHFRLRTVQEQAGPIGAVRWPMADGRWPTDDERGLRMRQLKFAFRTLFKSPFVTTVAILSLALGIGANAAIFSLFDQMLLRPLPVRAPGELVNLSAPGPKPGSQSCSQAGDCERCLQLPDVPGSREDRRPSSPDSPRTSGFGVNLSYDQQPRSGDGMLVSGSYFPVLGVTPAAGRLLGPSDDETIGSNFVTVLSYTYWQSRFGGDPSMIGKHDHDQRPVDDDRRRRAQGLRWHHARLAAARVRADLDAQGHVAVVRRLRESSELLGLSLRPRSSPGVSIAQARRGLNALYHPIINDVEAPLQKGMSDADDGSSSSAKRLVVDAGPARAEFDAHPGEDAAVHAVRRSRRSCCSLPAPTSRTCCSPAARTARWRWACASRSARAGGSCSTQLLTESVCSPRSAGSRASSSRNGRSARIGTLLPPDADSHAALPARPDRASSSPRCCPSSPGLLFGMFPALHSTRADLVTTIRANAGQISGARAAARFRATLVTAQIALSMALLISAGLFMKSLLNVSRVDLGMHVDNVVTFGVSPQRAAMTVRTCSSSTRASRKRSPRSRVSPRSRRRSFRSWPVTTGGLTCTCKAIRRPRRGQ